MFRSKEATLMRSGQRRGFRPAQIEFDPADEWSNPVQVVELPARRLEVANDIAILDDLERSHGYRLGHAAARS